jgi:poly-gamma-glutamate synthesis protein (capsule biosynthesis protein)
MPSIFRNDVSNSIALTIAALLLVLPLIHAQESSNLQNLADPGIRDASRFDPKRPLDRELQTNVSSPFSLVAVGDCIISRPLSQYASRQPDFAVVLELLRKGDATYGNMETTILDIREFKGFPYTGPDDVPLIAEPAVAHDLASMGFDLLSRSNNHALDWGLEGMRETSHWLDQADLVHAGTGEDRGLARAAHYFETNKGRVALVSMASTFRPTTDSLPSHGGAPGRPGINALTLKKTTIVPASAMAELVQLVHTLYPNYKEPLDANPPKNTEKTPIADPPKLSLFGNEFELGDTFRYQYDMDPIDLSEILKNIRQGKQHSDFLIATIHSHEPATSTAPKPATDFSDSPAPFLRDLARAAIDSGADAFITTGIHHLGPIEVYKGRPIFYGLGDFFWSDIQEPMPADIFQLSRQTLANAFANPDRATDADLTNAINAESFAGEPPFQSIVSESRFDQGRLAELRLYPVELGYGMKLTESGIPRLASATKGLEILKRLQSISAPYGTKIEIESVPQFNYVGIVRP